MSSTTGRIEHFINGKHVRGGGRTSDVFNPATGEVSAQVTWLPRRKWTRQFLPRATPSRLV